MVHANLFARLLTRLVDSPPLVCTAHSFREGGTMRMLAYRLTDRWTALTTHVSQDGRAGMIAAGGVPDDRIVVMPNGIDVERFRPDPALREATRAKLGHRAGYAGGPQCRPAGAGEGPGSADPCVWPTLTRRAGAPADRGRRRAAPRR